MSPAAALGRWCVRHAAWVLLLWVAVAGALNVAVPSWRRPSTSTRRRSSRATFPA
ncbi:hypothetical protein [Tsukamurella soli]|uniref:hypothetical protein n=1 Tax=Tsukamurella soli TaxID=644556 RepID=UPI0031E66FA2